MTKAILTVSLIFFLLSTQFVAAQTAPDFTYTDTEGVTHTLSERLNEGYIIVLDFFFVDCPPCLETGIELEAIHNDYQGQNVEVWSVTPYDSISYIEEFRLENDFTYRMGGIEGGSWEIAELFIDSLGLSYFPTVSVICPDGEMNWDIWPYTSGGAPEWRAPVENCGVHDISVTSDVSVETGNYQVDLFPNPVQEVLNVEFFTENTSDIRAEIFDFTGKKILENVISIATPGQQTYQFKTDKFHAGNYVLRLSNEKNTVGISSFQK